MKRQEGGADLKPHKLTEKNSIAKSAAKVEESEDQKVDSEFASLSKKAKHTKKNKHRKP